MRPCIVALALMACLPGLGQTVAPTAPLQNWGIPTYIDEYPLPAGLTNYQSATQGGLQSQPCSIPSDGLRFYFTIDALDTQASLPATVSHAAAQGAISTSAVVYDSTAKILIATLWNNVTLKNGGYCGIWNGYPDTGTSATLVTDTSSPYYGHNFQIRILYDNVQYTWDGTVGETDTHLNSWNWASSSSFPQGIAFVYCSNASNSSNCSSTTTEYGVVDDGYSESTTDASIFVNSPSGDPNTLWPLNLALAGNDEFQFTTTDGATVYFAAITGQPTYYSAVVAFRLTGQDPPLFGGSHQTETVSTNSSNGSGTCPAGAISDPDDCEVFSSTSLTESNGPGPWATPYIFTGAQTVTCPYTYDSDLCIPSTGAVNFFNNAPFNVQLDNQNSSYTQTPTTLLSGDGSHLFDNGIAESQSNCQPVSGSSGSCGSPIAQPVITAPGIPITGIAVERSNAANGNLLVVAEGRFDPLGCNDVNQVANNNYSTIAFFDKSTGQSLATFSQANGITNWPANPQKMAFDQEGDLWVIDGGVPARDCTTPATPLLGNRNKAGMDPIWLTYGRLLKMTIGGTAGSPTITSVSVISGLSNPVDVATDPQSPYSVFIADGGAHQQVYTMSGMTPVATNIGTAGGYGIGWSGGVQGGTPSTCNATFSPSKLWLDYYARGSAISRPWISVDNEHEIWVGDSSTSRILTFANQSGTYSLVNTISMNTSLYNVAVPQNAPTRVFTGHNGMLEYTVDYPSNDIAESQLLTSNNAFTSTLANNWLPCFLQQEWVQGGFTDTNAVVSSVEQFSGNTFGFVYYDSDNPTLHGGSIQQRNAVIELPSTGGTIAIENDSATNVSPYIAHTIAANPFSVWFDSNGSYYQIANSGTTCPNSPTSGNYITLYQFPADGTDANSFPVWVNGVIHATSLATLSPVLANGDPCPGRQQDGYDLTPTSLNHVIPIYSMGSAGGWQWNNPSTTNPNSTPSYHLGGVVTGASSFQWHAQLETCVEYPSLTTDSQGETLCGTSSSTPSKVNNLGLYSTWHIPGGSFKMGYAAHAIDNFIFTGINGNWHQFSCQFYQQTDDGMLVGQFGWRGSNVYPYANSSAGFPNYMLGEALAPGVCGNPVEFKTVRVYNNSSNIPNYPAQYEYYLYVTDEGYRKGVQRWHIWNTSSIYCVTSTTAAFPGHSTDLETVVQGQCPAAD